VALVVVQRAPTEVEAAAMAVATLAKRQEA